MSNSQRPIQNKVGTVQYHDYQNQKTDMHIAGNGKQRDLDLGQIAQLMQSSQIEHKMEGLELLSKVLKYQNPNKLPEGESMPSYKVPVLYSRQHISSQLSSVFKGFHTCLQTSELNVDLLMKTNQVLYDLMPDVARYPNDLQPEVAKLIPVLVANLGNSKALVRKSTHKCIGTFVKFSKQLEIVLTQLIKSGLNSSNQRTRQHSMLVIPALISLKPIVVEQQSREMHEMVGAVIEKLTDPAEIVAKTAKKLLLELEKCYPKTFQNNYVQTLKDQRIREICQHIINSRFDDAQQLIDSLQETGKLVQATGKLDEVQLEFNEGKKPIQQKSIQKEPEKQEVVKSDPEKVQAIRTEQIIKEPVKTKISQVEEKTESIQIQQEKTVQPSTVTSQSILIEKTISNTPLIPSSQSKQDIYQSLSVVGKEIVSSQPSLTAALQQKSKATKPITKPKADPPPKTETQSSIEQSPVVNQATQSSNRRQQLLQSLKGDALKEGLQGESIQPKEEESQPFKPELKFGFLEQSLIDQLNEEIQWKERNTAMELIESKFQHAISAGQETKLLTETNATEFVTFIYPLIADINFKISVAALKMTTELLKRKHVRLLQSLSVPLIDMLLEKLSDSKEVIRKLTLNCCFYIIENPQIKTQSFVNQAIKSLHHANQQVRSGIITLLCKCVLAQNNSQSDQAGQTPLTQSQTLIEEVCFLVKVEDKQQLQQMGIDLLALCIHVETAVTSKSRPPASKPAQQTKTEALIMKEFEIPVDQDQQMAEAKEKQLKKWLFDRVKEKYIPFINKNGDIEFHPWIETQSNFHKPSTTNEIQHSKVETPTPQSAGIIQNLDNPILMPSTQERSPQTSLGGKGRDDFLNSHGDHFQGQHPNSAGLKKVHLHAQTPSVHMQHPGSAQQHQAHQLKAPVTDNSESSTYGQKIAMWLPTFTPGPQGDANSALSDTPNTYQASLRDTTSIKSPAIVGKLNKEPNHGQLFTGDSPNYRNKQQRITTDGNQVGPNSLNLNQTASSAATLVDDGHRSIFTSTTATKQGKQHQTDMNSRTPISFDNQTSVGIGTQNNFRVGGHFGSNPSNVPQDYNVPSQTQYVPQAHSIKPRNIQSGHSTSSYEGFMQSNGQSSIPTSAQNHTTTMSQSSGSSGFDKAQINDRLQLLKSTYKYNKAGANSFTIQQQPLVQGAFAKDYNQSSNLLNEQTSNLLLTKQNSGGPVKAMHVMTTEENSHNQSLDEELLGFRQNKKMSHQTDQFDSTFHANQSKINFQNSNGKPPINKPTDTHSNFSGSLPFNDAQSTASLELKSKIKSTSQQRNTPNSVQQKPQQYAHSEKKQPPKTQNQGVYIPSSLQMQEQAHQYDIVEEPLPSPETQIKQAIADLKSSDWSKQFEACNIIKRGIMYHKNLFTHPSQFTQQVFKEIITPVDSLRSQVSKNACLALGCIFDELNARDCDAHVETVMPTLIKRATNTNQFISEAAEQTLISCCINCSEHKVFAALQNQNLKSNAFKEKACQCYNILIEKLGSKLKNFKDVERLVQAVTHFLDESAAEVRNKAKFGILTINNVCSSQRELEGLMLKCRLNDKQKDKIRKIIASEDFESLSNYNQTKYGGSMKSSPHLTVGQFGDARHTSYGNGVRENSQQKRSNWQ